MELEVVSCIKGREAGSWEEREGAWGRDGGMQEEREEYSREWGRRDHTRDSLLRRGWELMFSPSGGRRTVCFPGCEDPDVYLYMDNRFYSSNNKLLRSHTRMHAHTHTETPRRCTEHWNIHMHAYLRTPRHMPTPNTHTHTHALHHTHHAHTLANKALCGDPMRISWTGAIFEPIMWILQLDKDVLWKWKKLLFFIFILKKTRTLSEISSVTGFGIGTGQLGRIVPKIFFFQFSVFIFWSIV